MVLSKATNVPDALDPALVRLVAPCAHVLIPSISFFLSFVVQTLSNGGEK